jgi:hypothetical protein
MFESFFAKLAGKYLANKLNLQEGNMDDTKKWYLSKGIWAGVVTALMGLYLSLAPQLHLPAVPEWIFSILGVLGVYSRATAETKVVS